jgi:hypothetical protein
MTKRMDMRASSLSNNLFSSFFRASLPPNSASGSRAVAGSLLRWSYSVPLGPSEDIARLARVWGRAYLSRDGERSGSDSKSS